MTPADGRVTVSVLTHDRAAAVARTVGHLVALPERPRVIVVDNASTDGTAARLARRFPGVEVVRLPVNAGAAGRNAGVARAPTPYVALCDDDTWWAPGALARAADHLDRAPRLAAVTARVLVGPEEREDSACALMAASPLPGLPEIQGTRVLGFLAGACMVRRQAFLAVGGFEPRLFLGGEEQLLAADLAAAGWLLAYVPDVVVHHHPSPRDGTARRRLLARNALWFAWLRLPAAAAARRTLRIVAAAVSDPEARAALGDALRGLPWALAHRRRLPPEVGRLLLAVDRPPPMAAPDGGPARLR